MHETHASLAFARTDEDVIWAACFQTIFACFCTSFLTISFWLHDHRSFLGYGRRNTHQVFIFRWVFMRLYYFEISDSQNDFAQLENVTFGKRNALFLEMVFREMKLNKMVRSFEKIYCWAQPNNSHPRDFHWISKCSRCRAVCCWSRTWRLFLPPNDEKSW